MQITKNTIHSNNSFLLKEENHSLFSMVLTIEEDKIDSISKEQWTMKLDMIGLYLAFFDTYYWEVTDKTEKQKIARATTILRQQKMICEYAIMTDEERIEIHNIAQLFGKKVQSSIL